MNITKTLALLKAMYRQLSPFFRAQLLAELQDLASRYMAPLRGEGPPG